MNFRHITYWFMGGNLVATVIFTVFALAYGGRDLKNFLHALKCAETDDADDGRVVQPSQE